MVIIMEIEDKYIIAIQWALGEFDLTQAEAGEMMGVVQSAVSQMIGKSRSIKPKHIKGLAKGIGMTVDTLLSKSVAGHHINDAPKENNVINIDHQHAEIIKKFQNRDLALVINQELLDLESMDPDKLKSVLDFIKFQKKEAAETVQKKREAGNDKT